MIPCLHIIRPGLLTTVQDLGRPGFQNFGIAVAGALDPIALRAANALAGNPPGAGALEVLYAGPTIEVEADSVRMSFAGADAAIEILADRTTVHGTPVETMRSVTVRRGEIVRIGSLSAGAVLYVGVEGGFDIEPTLGSVSTDIRGGIGGWQNRALATGDLVPLRLAQASDRAEGRMVGLDLTPPSAVRAIPGPQSDYFARSEIEAFFASEYTVGTGTNRQGMRLEGRPISHLRGYNITSDAIAPGSIQVPGNGLPIALLADRQTTGGYPKIVTVISADVPALGRLPVGAKFKFEAVTLEQAQEARRTFLDRIKKIADKIVPLSHSRPDSTSNLSDHNLISGVVDAWSI
jgi:biotin-dependent carboxylase-like uncharacterized protein